MIRAPIVAIVPMKAYSERVPGKNIRKIDGHPLCWHVLNTIRNSEVEKIIVDTDSEEIGDIVESFGLNIEVSFRPSEYCKDLHGNTLLHRFVEDPNAIYVQSHVTSPFLKVSSLNKGIEAIRTGKTNNAFSVTEMKQRAWQEKYPLLPLNHDGYLNPIKTQQLQSILFENGAFFMFKGSFYLERGTRNGATGYPIKLSWIESLDVDTEEDFKQAELLFNAIRNTKNA